MADQSKAIDPASTQEAVSDVIKDIQNGQTVEAESDHEDDEDNNEPADDTVAASSATKKKKSKRKRIKKAIMGGSSSDTPKSAEKSTAEDADAAFKNMVSGLSKDQLRELVKMNPVLEQQLQATGGGALSDKDLAAAVKKLSVEDMMTGLASSGKNVKDMASYKFWQTQPVPKFGDTSEIKEGPFKIIKLEDVPKEPGALLPGFEWVTIDLTDDAEIEEVYQLLYGHYVEDDEAMFRFNYSLSFLKWCVSLQMLCMKLIILQGLDCSWLDQGLACWYSRDGVSQTSSIHLCHTSSTASTKHNFKGIRGQFPLHT